MTEDRKRGGAAGGKGGWEGVGEGGGGGVILFKSLHIAFSVHLSTLAKHAMNFTRRFDVGAQVLDLLMVISELSLL